jgi:hypothetical protein
LLEVGLSWVVSGSLGLRDDDLDVNFSLSFFISMINYVFDHLEFDCRLLQACEVRFSPNIVCNVIGGPYAGANLAIEQVAVAPHHILSLAFLINFITIIFISDWPAEVRSD